MAKGGRRKIKATILKDTAEKNDTAQSIFFESQNLSTTTSTTMFAEWLLLLMTIQLN